MSSSVRSLYSVIGNISNSGLSTDKKYNYTSINLRAVQVDGTVLDGPTVDNLSLTSPNYSGNVAEYSVRYLDFTSDRDLVNRTINIGSRGGSFDITLIYMEKKLYKSNRG